jgi:hypothetical protein
MVGEKGGLKSLRKFDLVPCAAALVKRWSRGLYRTEIRGITRTTGLLASVPPSFDALDGAGPEVERQQRARAHSISLNLSHRTRNYA